MRKNDVQHGPDQEDVGAKSIAVQYLRNWPRQFPGHLAGNKLWFGPTNRVAL